MSTISSTKEAYEALCAGELFQVGGRFINPADIVEVDPNGGQNPIFRLADGRTVQHDRFQQGDVGDFLADALEYATRGQAQSEQIKPPATMASMVLVDGNGRVYSRSATDLTEQFDYGNTGGARSGQIPFLQDYFIVNESTFGGSGDIIDIYEFDGESINQVDQYDPTTASGTFSNMTGGAKYIVVNDAGEFGIYDKESQSEVKTINAVGDGMAPVLIESEPAIIGGDASTGSADIEKYDFTGSQKGSQNLSTADSLQRERHGRNDPKNKKLYIGHDGGELYQLEYDLTINWKFSVSNGEEFEPVIAPDGSHVLVLDTGRDAFSLLKSDGTEVLKDIQLPASGPANGLNAAVDQAAENILIIGRNDVYVYGFDGTKKDQRNLSTQVLRGTARYDLPPTS